MALSYPTVDSRGFESKLNVFDWTIEGPNETATGIPCTDLAWLCLEKDTCCLTIETKVHHLDCWGIWNYGLDRRRGGGWPVIRKVMSRI